MEPALHPRSASALAAIAAGLILVFGASSAAIAKPPPSPGLRVVWEKDLSIDAVRVGDARASADAGSDRGLWPRVDRIELRAAAAGPQVHEGASGFDVRGRWLPHVGARGDAVR